MKLERQQVPLTFSLLVHFTYQYRPIILSHNVVIRNKDFYQLHNVGMCLYKLFLPGFGIVQNQSEKNILTWNNCIMNSAELNPV